jgi:hypothetical protein
MTDDPKPFTRPNRGYWYRLKDDRCYICRSPDGIRKHGGYSCVSCGIIHCRDCEVRGRTTAVLMCLECTDDG